MRWSTGSVRFSPFTFRVMPLDVAGALDVGGAMIGLLSRMRCATGAEAWARAARVAQVTREERAERAEQEVQHCAGRSAGGRGATDRMHPAMPALWWSELKRTTVR
ncbi:hypothetical protein GCM10012286_47510 [Streptomyces lasiicapitis]|uniref:Uncharacterized protein n=1 Tax=Streptomyces lasiicapitis TaxID=1923961 RepID=A0ABQ2MB14_9ACTN|nr:hypothetical protein GCM10012286_47510 [Streptomyces lasiicapitis]